MPTYHYRCKNCNYDFTEQQSFTDDPITVCPECGEEQVRKVYSAVPIEFKGSGFYRTDKSMLTVGQKNLVKKKNKKKKTEKIKQEDKREVMEES